MLDSLLVNVNKRSSGELVKENDGYIFSYENLEADFISLKW